MESMMVNWEALDALVIDFATSEHLIEEDSAPSSSPFSPLSSSSYHSRLLIRRIRRSLLTGDVDAALDLLRAHVPSVLDDRRILFRLQKQKFIELLRKGTQEDRDAAINSLRTALAPCALDAYPEAYEEFKHVLLAFIYDKDDQNSPVAFEWSERRRFDIAGLLSSVLISHLNAYDPVLSMTLRYLISIHKGFCFRQGISSAISDLTERLLLEERDPPAMPQESLYEAPPFDEVDIQALAHAVEITRQGAVDSLRFAKGDLFRAFQNELCRMKMNDTVMDELVREYCVYRGIVGSGTASQPVSETQLSSGPAVDLTESGPGCCLSMKSSSDAVCASSQALDGESSNSTHYANDSPGCHVGVRSTQSSDLDQRYLSETAGNLDDCSTSGLQHPVNLNVQQRIRRQGVGERNKRKRWKGRQEKIVSASGVFCGSDEEVADYPSILQAIFKEQWPRTGLLLHVLNLLLTLLFQEQRSSLLNGAIMGEEKYEVMLAIKELACRGMAAEVVEEINSVDQGFFVQNPELLFQLKQVEFLKLVSAGDHSGALRVACSHLGPLAASDPALLKPLKETLLSLLRPNEEAFYKCLPFHALATSVQVAIGRRLGIEEPQLMKILKATLYAHNEWFKLQMSKDQFEGVLRINSLKEVYPSLLADAAALSSGISSHGSSHASTPSVSRLQDDLGSPTQTSSSDVCDESAIIKVMEFLALPRADAIHLLAQYNGNAETVIQQIFA